MSPSVLAEEPSTPHPVATTPATTTDGMKEKKKKERKERKEKKEKAADAATAASEKTEKKEKKHKKSGKESDNADVAPAAAKENDSATPAAATDVDTSKDGRSRTTLFVSTIPFHATSAQLEEFFSDIGPVRSCFVVADRKAEKEGRNKGYGYVAYAMPDDAERAIKELKKKKFMETRTLKMDYAVHKKVAEDRKASGLSVTDAAGVPARKPRPISVAAVDADGSSAAPAAARAPTPYVPYKPRVLKQTTVQISGLPADVTQKQIYKKVRKFGEVVQVVFPVLKNGVEVLGLAQSIYASAEDAKNAITHLDGHQFKGAHILAKDVTEESKTAKQARLIVRNLAWQCEGQHLRKAFARFGTIVDVLVPPAVNGKAKGFGFVQFETAEEAAKAIEGMNGQELIRRAIAVDWALPKAQYDRAVQEESAPAAAAKPESADKPAGEEAGEVLDEEEAQFYHDTIGDGADDESEADDNEDDDDDEAEEEEEDDFSSEDEEVTYVPKPRKPSGLAADVSDNCTLFIRNLSFETTEDELSEAFGVFGELRYARITMDRATGRARGTGFVCYKNKEDAAACMAAYDQACKQSATLESFTGAPATAADAKHQKNKKLAPTKSILAPEPSLTAVAATPFTLGARFLNVTFAVNRADASVLEHDGKLRRRAEDSRNLYLMREGVVFPDTKAAETLTPAELAKRQTSFAERKRILATNPNLFVSRTRLSVRNLGLKVDDKELKKVAGIAVRKFWDEVRKGLREGMEPEVIKEELAEGRAEPSGLRRAVLSQAKVLRSKDRIDAATKMPRSKGYGFIEFESHADALACLRWMNNNPKAFRPAPVKEVPVVEAKKGKKSAKNAKKEAAAAKKAKDAADAAAAAAAAADEDDEITAASAAKRPIVEFAIENRQVLKRRDERRDQATRGNGKRGRDGEDAAATDGEPAKKKRFGEIWLERRLAQKAKKQAMKNEKKDKKSGSADASTTAAVDNNKRKRTDDDGKGSWRDDKNRRSAANATNGATKKPRGPNHDIDGVVPDRVAKPKKSGPSKDEKKEAKFDSLVQQYKKNLFGGVPPAPPPATAGTAAVKPVKPAAAGADSEKGIRRWFT
ncbi:RNA recognition motif-containing protein [Geranomyces variabilis]|uniref:RNA recognition motif-containing protein n=1 Tax=Geranomyces variabilis TaxID=109894 RepID=A0AAD5TQU9_9FUNG|nr:RNA recognition motif-containing protein [Geranomyces variabilis]